MIYNPHTINYNPNINEQSYTYMSDVTATDAIDGSLSVSIVQNTSNIVKSQLGTYSVMYTASDLSGNIVKVI